MQLRKTVNVESKKTIHNNGRNSKPKKHVRSIEKSLNKKYFYNFGIYLENDINLDGKIFLAKKFDDIPENYRATENTLILQLNLDKKIYDSKEYIENIKNVLKSVEGIEYHFYNVVILFNIPNGRKTNFAGNIDFMSYYEIEELSYTLIDSLEGEICEMELNLNFDVVHVIFSDTITENNHGNMIIKLNEKIINKFQMPNSFVLIEYNANNLDFRIRLQEKDLKPTLDNIKHSKEKSIFILLPTIVYENDYSIENLNSIKESDIFKYIHNNISNQIDYFFIILTNLLILFDYLRYKFGSLWLFRFILNYFMSNHFDLNSYTYRKKKALIYVSRVEKTQEKLKYHVKRDVNLTFISFDNEFDFEKNSYIEFYDFEKSDKMLSVKDYYYQRLKEYNISISSYFSLFVMLISCSVALYFEIINPSGSKFDYIIISQITYTYIVKKIFLVAIRCFLFVSILYGVNSLIKTEIIILPSKSNTTKDANVIKKYQSDLFSNIRSELTTFYVLLFFFGISFYPFLYILTTTYIHAMGIRYNF